MRVDAQQERVVVQHLLEVRDDPLAVHAVAGEATADLVVHPATRHRPECLLRHRKRIIVTGERVVAEQELQHHRRRELGCSREPARSLVELPPQRRDCLREILGRGQESIRRQGRANAQCVHDALSGGEHIVTTVPPCLGKAVQQLREGRQSVARLGREVGAGVEGSAIVVDEHRHRPAPMARQAHGGVHVDGVDVGPLLAVDLDAHEVVVEQAGDGLVLEGLVRHDVAPVAGAVAHRDEDRDVTPAGLRERLLTPLPPVHGVVCVLLEIGTRGVRQAIGHHSSSRIRLDVIRLRM